MPSTTLAVINTDALIANVPGAKPSPQYTPPAIHHRGITLAQLQALTGCVRGADPSPFPGPLEAWRGKRVVFTLAGTSSKVTRIIESVAVKPVGEVSDDDLKGTLAEIAMRELAIPFEQFFHQAYGNQATAMVIRVRAP